MPPGIGAVSSPRLTSRIKGLKVLASIHFKIRRSASDDWFDTILNSDTRLFIDPFLIFKDKATTWASAHGKIIEHFNRAFELIAQGNMNPESLAYRKALHLLEFPEPKELCLGYTAKGTRGAGGGSGYADRIGEAIAQAIHRGLKHPRHFEELGILNEGIGPDRISDATGTILKAELIAYTQEICTRHNIPTTRHTIFASGFDETRSRWTVDPVEAPTNPFTGKAFLFVPRRFLAVLPTLNADDWWESSQAKQLRDDINFDIMGRVDKATIVEIARNHPETVRAWTNEKEAEPAKPYDFERDPKGVWLWDAATMRFAETFPLSLIDAKSQGDFSRVLEMLVAQFKLYIEEQGGWSLLWNDNGAEKPEGAVQLLFRGIVQNYCHANDINIDREVNLGRGPVDFKFSSGYKRRALLEIKKLHHGQFWDGLTEQLPSYQKSDSIKDGWLLAVHYRNNRTSNVRAKQLRARVAAVAAEKDLNLRYEIVDARRPRPASKLRATR
jgi:hypothetical protein